jgi:KDO2-lipid IV(A) lauroyltransferase
MLVDQKMNDGIAVPFFDRPAMTASAVAELALKFRCPVVPLRCERLGGAHFRVTALPPLLLPDTGDRIADSYSLMLNINQLIESWIREHPEQWLWLHRRWPAESSTK